MAPTNQDYKTRQLTGGKAPKARVARYLKTTESQLREGAKSTLLFRGIASSQVITTLLQELRSIQAPHSKLLSKKNQIVSFSTEGQQSIEFLTTKNDAALFAMGSHNKKRPHNLLMGRTFDRQILDMAELGILRFKSVQDYGGQVPKKRIGSKPLLLFVGDGWDSHHHPSSDYRNLQNLLIDFYRGDVVDRVILSGLDHIIVFTLGEPLREGGSPMIHQRTYFCKLKKNPNGSSTPAPHLVPCGPDVDMILRRSQWADPDLYRLARKQPFATRKKKTRNQNTNLFGETIGRLHLEKQNVDQLQGRKVKAIRRADKIAAAEEKAAIEQELGQEKQGMDQEFEATFGFKEN